MTPNEPNVTAFDPFDDFVRYWYELDKKHSLSCAQVGLRDELQARFGGLVEELQCCAHTFAAMTGSGPAHARRIQAKLDALKKEWTGS